MRKQISAFLLTLSLLANLLPIPVLAVESDGELPTVIDLGGGVEAKWDSDQTMVEESAVSEEILSLLDRYNAEHPDQNPYEPMEPVSDIEVPDADIEVPDTMLIVGDTVHWKISYEPMKSAFNKYGEVWNVRALTRSSCVTTDSAVSVQAYPQAPMEIIGADGQTPDNHDVTLLIDADRLSGPVLVIYYCELAVVYENGNIAVFTFQTSVQIGASSPRTAYVVSFHPNGGTVGVTSKIVLSGEAYGALPTPEREGCDFLGWFTALEGGEQVTAETIVSLKAGQTLYAHWSTAGGNCGENLRWNIIDGVLTITGTGAMYDYKDAPPENSAPWKAMFREIFKIALGDGVTTVGNYAFSGCRLASEVSFPDSMQKIGAGAFTGCQSLGKVSLPSGITELGNAVFSGCSLLNEVSLPASLRTIPYSAFSNCGNLEKVSLPEQLKSIGNYAFSYCSRLTQIDLPAGLEVIGSDTFQHAGLTSVILPEGLTTVSGWAFYYSKLTRVSLPKSLQTVASNAFYSCSSLRDVDYAGTPEEWSAIQIESSNEPLTSATVHFTSFETNSLILHFDPNGGKLSANDTYKAVTVRTAYGPLPVPTRQGFSFDGWHTAKDGGTIVTEETVASTTGTVTLYAHWTASSACGENVTWTLENGVLRVSGTGEMYDFDSVDNVPWYPRRAEIRSVETGEGVTSVGNYAFYDFSTLETASFLSVERIGRMSFYICRNLREISWPQSLRTIDAYAFCYCDSLNALTLPDGLETIRYHAFHGCENLQSVHVPGSVKTLEDAFDSCKNLTSVTLAEGIQEIESHTFDYCYALEDVSIPESVTKIGYSAFGNSYVLKDVYYGGSPSTWMAIDIGYSNEYLKNATIHFGKRAENERFLTFEPNGGRLTLKQKVVYNGSPCGELPVPSRLSSSFAGWYTALEGGTRIDAETVANFSTDSKLYARWETTSKCGDNITWTLTDGVMTLSGSGAMYHYGSGTANETPWQAHKQEIVSIVVNNGITAIGNSAFSGCAALESLTLPEGLQTIGSSAFSGCAALESLTLPEGLQTIGGSAFYGCSSLTEIVLPDGITTLGGGAFAKCASLRKVTIPSSLTELNKFTSIFSGKFSGDVGSFSFTALEQVAIPEGVRILGAYAFSNCSELTSVTLPNSLEQFSSNAFSGCSALQEIHFNGSAAEWAFISSGSPLNARILLDGRKSGEYLLTLNSAGGSVSTPYRVVQNGRACGALPVPSLNVSNATVIFEGWYTAPEGGEQITAQTVMNLTEDITLYAHWRLSGEAGENHTWTLQGSSMTVSGTGDIPDYSSYSSTPWYLFRSDIKTLTIEEGVTGIGESAFEYCQNLVSVTLPKGLLTLGESAFENCQSLASVTLPEGLVTLGRSAFENCKSLKSITIPEGVTTLSTDLFENSGLTSIWLPISVRSIDSWALRCPIKDIYYAGNEEAWRSVSVSIINNVSSATIHYGETALLSLYFNGNNGKADTNRMTVPVGGAYGTLPNATRPGCTFLGWFTAQEGGEAVTSATPVTTSGQQTLYAHWQATDSCGEGLSWSLSNGTLTVRGSGVMYDFQGSSSEAPWYERRTEITSVILNSGVTNVASRAFISCKNLRNVTLPTSVKEIGTLAFNGCSALGSISLPTGLTSIGDSTFSGCESLGSIVIPDGVTTIPKQAFSSCNALENITLPASLTSIASNAFSSCYKLAEIHFKGTASQWVELHSKRCNETILRANVFIEGNRDGGYLATFRCRFGTLNYSLDTFDFDDLSYGIGTKQYLAVKNGEMFGTLPTFQKNLDDLDCDLSYFPNSWKFEGWYTSEYGGEKITEDTVVSLTDDTVFYAHYSYQGTTGDVSWTFDDESGQLTFSGSGAMAVYDPCWVGELTPWTEYLAERIRTVVVEPGVTSLCDYAFQNCKNLSSVTLPTSLQQIGVHTFKGCTSLQEVEIPNGITALPEGMLLNSAVTTITLPKSLNTIGNAALNSISLKEIYYSGSELDWQEITIGENNSTLEQAVIHYGTNVEFTVTFNPCGGTVNPDSQSVAYGKTYGTLPVPIRDGYVFLGWFTTMEGGTKIAEDSVVNIRSNTTLYAQWKANSYSVTFNANGGTGTMSAQTFAHGVAGTLNANGFTRSGYSFTGWNEKADGSGKSYADKSSVTLTAALTLYAQWDIYWLFGRDNYAFINTYGNKSYIYGFGEGPYYISNKDLQDYLETLDKDEIELTADWFAIGDTTTPIEQKIQMLRANRLINFKGSCYGLSLTAQLIRVGIVSPSKFGGSSTFKIPGLKYNTNTPLESWINIAQISQARNASKWVCQAQVQTDKFPSVARNMFDKARLIGSSFPPYTVSLHGYSSDGRYKGHAVVCVGAQSGDFNYNEKNWPRRLMIADPNKTSLTYIYVSEDYRNAIYSGDMDYNQFGYRTASLSDANPFSGLPSLMSLEEPLAQWEDESVDEREATASLTTSGGVETKISTANGYIVVKDNEVLQTEGNIQVEVIRPIGELVDGVEDAVDTRALILLYTDDIAETVYLSAANENEPVSATLYRDDYSVFIKGNVGEAAVRENGEVFLMDTKDDLHVFLALNESDLDFVTIEGASQGDVSISMNNEGNSLCLQGGLSDYTVAAMDLMGDTQELTVSGNADLLLTAEKSEEGNETVLTATADTDGDGEFESDVETIRAYQLQAELNEGTLTYSLYAPENKSVLLIAAQYNADGSMVSTHSIPLTLKAEERKKGTLSVSEGKVVKLFLLDDSKKLLCRPWEWSM